MLAAAAWLTLAASACFDGGPDDWGLTPAGSGALVRFDLAHKPLPEIPLPNDVATWADPTSRTGLRINASLVAPTRIETQARERFSQMEGWGTFAPISVAFQPAVGSDASATAIDLANVRARHQRDDYDFADDALYLIDLATGLPAVLDVGNGNFDYTLKRLDRYWANDTRQSERNLLFETIDESNGGSILNYEARFDSDFDGVLDRPNFEQLTACPNADPICDDPANGEYASADCLQLRRSRDRCVADNLLTFYERETDTLIVRPLLPLNEMQRYAVVLTDRLVDVRGEPVRSPFQRIFHASQRSVAERIEQVFNDPERASYYGDLHGSGIRRVSFVWGFTTQPTVDDMRRLRDGLYGQGPFKRWADSYPATLEVQRAIGLTDQLAQGASDAPGWETSSLGMAAGCPDKASNLWIVDYDGIRGLIRDLLINAFGLSESPSTELLLRRFENISHMVVAQYRVPFLLEGGPASTDPNSAFSINYQTGQAEETSDVVQVWMIIPRATATHKQPFDVNIYGHGYTGNFSEMLLYAGNMAEQGLATVGINAMGHGLSFGNDAEITLARAALAGACVKPLYDALSASRARDLNRDGQDDSGGDFWSSYLFHTRDGVRQSVLDHIQLVRIMRGFGSASMNCRNDALAADAKLAPCDVDADGKVELAGDFDGDGVADLGGSEAHYGTWGESLGGILSAIHGAVDPFVTSAVPGSGGGGLTDIGVRSFQGGVIEAVLLRLWGPLLVAVPASSRQPCTPSSADDDRCTVCAEGQLSLRWVLPDVNGTGEVEADCLQSGTISGTTVRVLNSDNHEVRCARVDEAQRFRVPIPASVGDRIIVQFYDGTDTFASYADCGVEGAPLRHVVQTWNVGRFAEGAQNGAESASCHSTQCSGFQGIFYPVGTPLTAPGEGFGLLRQSPGLRRFLSLAQAALEPGDPISFAPYYALKPMVGPFGAPIEPHALLTLNTIGDMNVPINSGIAFARASGALPFMRPEQAARYPEYADYVTPADLYQQLGDATPNQLLIDRHVIEGITELARHPAAPECAASQNAAALDASFLDSSAQSQACFPSGCTPETESSSSTRRCFPGQSCDFDAAQCRPNPLGQRRCDEALWDTDDLDQGSQHYFEQASQIPHRLARLTSSARDRSLAEVWAPRLRGLPGHSDSTAYKPAKAPAGRLTALLNAYTVPEGEHTFVNGDPCQGFDHGSYLTNLVAHFFASDGTDLYYLSHPSSHHCLAAQIDSCP